MLRQILRFQFVARQSSKSVVTRLFSNKSTEVATKSIRKNSKNGLIFSSNIIICPRASTFYTGPLGTIVFKKYSTSNRSDNTESFEDLTRLLNDRVQRGDHNKALEYATKAMEISNTSDQFLTALTWKLPLQIHLNKPNWDDDFLATVQKLDPNSADFSESWERLFGMLCSLGSYDTRCTKFFEKAFKVFPNNFIVIMKKAEVLLNYGLADEAKNLLIRAIEIDSNRCRPYALLWKLHPADVLLQKAISCPDSEKDSFLWCEYATKQILQDGNIEAGMESLKKAVADRSILPAVETTLNTIAVQLHTVNVRKNQK